MTKTKDSTIPYKIVFFDMDGPICNRRTHMTLSPAVGTIWREPDPIAIGFMNRLAMTDPAHTRFVCSSDWRENKSRDDMQDFLSQAGWIGAFHDDWETPIRDDDKKGHGYDITAWLSNHNDITSWIAIDDSIMGYNQSPRLIKADLEDGLPLSEMRRAFDMLHGISMLDAARMWKKNYKDGLFS